MKNKIWLLSLAIAGLLSSNIYAADKAMPAISSKVNVISCEGINKIGSEISSVILGSIKDKALEDIDYSAIDEFADHYLSDIDNKQVIEGYDCVYRKSSKDYTDITDYIKMHIDSNFDPSEYIITEDVPNQLPASFSEGVNVLDIRLNVNGYPVKNFGYRVYIMDNTAKIITFIGSMNQDLNIKNLKVPDISDEALIKKALEKDSIGYKVTDTNIFRYFDMEELKFKSDVEITYIDNSKCFFTTLNTLEL